MTLNPDKLPFDDHLLVKEAQHLKLLHCNQRIEK
jgi:hypothetical protein